MKKYLLVILLILSFLTCNKSNKVVESPSVTSDNNINEKLEQNLLPSVDSTHRIYEYDFYRVKLGNGNIIMKVNSIGKSSSVIDLEDNYDIVFINANNGMEKIIITDKYYKIKMLPVVFNETRDNRSGNDVIDTGWFKCFIFQILDNNNYRLIYVDDINNDMMQKEYEYKNSFFPDIIKILITPNFFIVEHMDIDGEEYTLINQLTGEYSVIDTKKEKGH